MSRDVHGWTSVAEDMDVRERLGHGCPRATSGRATEKSTAHHGGILFVQTNKHLSYSTTYRYSIKALSITAWIYVLSA